MTENIQLAAGSGSSVVVNNCQISGSTDLQPILFLGYLPPVNQMRSIGEPPQEQPAYPAQLLYCPESKLVQIGLIVDPNILFPPEYPYTSGTTKILRDNFAELYQDCQTIIPLTAEDLIVDIGSNDGTLLSNFHNGGHRVQGIEPTQRGEIANEKGIPTAIEFFGREIATKVKTEQGPAKVITATNVFAHIENVHEIVESILLLLDDKGVFISESHYLLSLVETLQYDTIYHEHLRYYSLQSLEYLFNMHGLEVIHAKRIPTHGGSIRVYAARKGAYPIQPSVKNILDEELAVDLNNQKLEEFKQKVVLSKLQLHSLLLDIKQQGHRIYGIGAPSRASTLINYVGIDDSILDCVVEVKGSYKTGKYMPGTLIPVIEETALFEEQPEYALLLSWHIAEELMPKLTQKGFKGKYIVPLPVPRIVEIQQ
ncbi:MAG: class I SAM-dependent methyltransferase [Symploca sp. SIO1C2]|nr:class I SAM-dependent methyltransferase [Symploca sp. SIO1C2]NER51059.1 class I SAM-dependent methyltransferase [Symploca sp. SIO1A3]